MEDLAIEYVNNLSSTNEFKRLIELKKIIDSKYSSLIVRLKNMEARYIEARQYPSQYDVISIQKEFSEAKSELYSKEEVKEYFKLERQLDEFLTNDLNDLKDSISNKFNKDEIMKI